MAVIGIAGRGGAAIAQYRKRGESSMLRFILGSFVIAALALTYSVNSAIAWAALAVMLAYVIDKRRRRAFSDVWLS